MQRDLERIKRECNEVDDMILGKLYQCMRDKTGVEDH